MADNEMEEQGAPIAALVADLMFAARVRGSAPEAGTAQSLPALLTVMGPATRLVVVDMQARGAEEAVAEARRRAPEARVVAFGPHVAEDALAAAREAGAHDVWPRGRFVRDLPALVADAMGAAGPADGD